MGDRIKLIFFLSSSSASSRKRLSDTLEYNRGLDPPFFTLDCPGRSPLLSDTDISSEESTPVGSAPFLAAAIFARRIRALEGEGVERESEARRSDLEGESWGRDWERGWEFFALGEWFFTMTVSAAME